MGGEKLLNKIGKIKATAIKQQQLNHALADQLNTPSEELGFVG